MSLRPTQPPEMPAAVMARTGCSIAFTRHGADTHQLRIIARLQFTMIADDMRLQNMIKINATELGVGFNCRRTTGTYAPDCHIALHRAAYGVTVARMAAGFPDRQNVPCPVISCRLVTLEQLDTR